MGSDDDDGWRRHRFAPGEEPTVYTTDLCAEVGHEHCKGIDRTIEGYEGETVLQSLPHASSLLTRAIDACGGKDNLPLLNSYMSEAKAKRMTWVEGLEYAIHRRKTSCDSPDQLD